MTEDRGLVRTYSDNHEYYTLKESLMAGKKEFAFAFLSILGYFYLWISHIQPMIMVLLGLLSGTWLAFSPSEWAVEGIESASGH